MSDRTRQLQELGQSLWLDNITRGMLDAGKIEDYRDHYAVTGLTSNPTIFQKAIESGDDYAEDIANAGSKEAEALFFDLAIDDLRRAADIFAPIHKRTCGVDGWVSLEVSPLLADDTAKTIDQAQKLHQRAARDNLYIKVPGTQAGVGAIEELIYRGLPINVTLLFSPRQYLAAAEAYLRGLERRAAEGLSVNVPSVASLFISRWDKKVAESVPAELRNTLGLAVARAVYVDYFRLLYGPRMHRLMNIGARPQRLLWASTGTKDPDASDVLYVENLAVPFTINTMPDKTLKAWADHGELPEYPPRPIANDAAKALEQYSAYVDSIDALGDTLQEEGAQAFSDSWKDLLAALDKQLKAAA